MALYSAPTFVDGTSPALSAENMNNLASCAAINQSYQIRFTVNAADWAGTPPVNTINYSVVAALSNITATSSGYCKIADTATDTQILQAIMHEVTLSSQSNGSIVFTCNGVAPSVDIPFVLTINSTGALAPASQTQGIINIPTTTNDLGAYPVVTQAQYAGNPQWNREIRLGTLTDDVSITLPSITSLTSGEIRILAYQSNGGSYTITVSVNEPTTETITDGTLVGSSIVLSGIAEDNRIEISAAIIGSNAVSILTDITPTD